MLGTAQPDPGGPRRARPSRVLGHVGVGPHSQVTSGIGVLQEPRHRRDQVTSFGVSLGGVKGALEKFDQGEGTTGTSPA